MTDNKDYIINIRVSKALYKKLRELAKEDGKSLSSVVRKTIDDGLEILGDLRDELFGEEGHAKSGDRIAHYEKVVVARDMRCEHCGKAIPKKTAAFLGETSGGERKYFCNDCATSA